MSSENNLHTGVLMVRGRGIGFITLPDFEEDIIIPEGATNTAFDGDIVEITLDSEKTENRVTGRVVRVVDRAREEYIGTVEARGATYRMNPDNKRIHRRFALDNVNLNHLGMKVAVTLTEWPDVEKDPHGIIVDVIGKAGDHETEIQAIIRGGGFATGFSKEVEDAAEALYQDRDRIFAEAEKDPRRRDFREVTTCTIDPADAKDFDDALSFQVLKNGNYEIGIHIADVSHYVRPGKPIDKEAEKRGTSIYLVDRVIPMLPEVLSNDLCSLRPDEDRLAFGAVFEITPKGSVENEWYGQTLIHSDHRFTYQDAQKTIKEGVGPLKEELTKMMGVSRILRTQRHKNGAIAFEQPEVKFELDEEKRPIGVIVKDRIESMLMIEDFMLLANQRVAEYVYMKGKKENRDNAFVYRVHDTPKPEKIEELAIFLHALGHEFKTHNGIVEAKEINALLKEVEGTPEENLIKTATIRSMAKAIYTTKNIGHFGLAFKYYTHFTSPIRRYPDLMVHRLLRTYLNGETINAKDRARYERLSIQSSESEARAVKAERDSIKFKQVEYMSDKVGQEFDGLITGVTEWGLYVEEKESKSEGMVKLSSINNDFFTHDPKNYRIKGERTGNSYRLGDEIRIKLNSVNLEDRQLDFVLA